MWWPAHLLSKFMLFCEPFLDSSTQINVMLTYLSRPVGYSRLYPAIAGFVFVMEELGDLEYYIKCFFLFFFPTFVIDTSFPSTTSLSFLSPVSPPPPPTHTHHKQGYNYQQYYSQYPQTYTQTSTKWYNYATPTYNVMYSTTTIPYMPFTSSLHAHYINTPSLHVDSSTCENYLVFLAVCCALLLFNHLLYFWKRTLADKSCCLSITMTHGSFWDALYWIWAPLEYTRSNGLATCTSTKLCCGRRGGGESV